MYTEELESQGTTENIRINQQFEFIKIGRYSLKNTLF